MRCSVLFLLVLLALSSNGQKIDIERIEPPFWWTGMKNKELQILVYGKNISNTTPSLNYSGVRLQSTVRTENPNYLFITLSVAENSQAGIIPIVFTNGRSKTTINYELKQRKKAAEDFVGFNTSDMIYLIMPDRFANGDETNDSPKGMLQGTDRKNPFGRHGGDLKGIQDNLDYIEKIGATALWINPVQENNQSKESYHGYAITDFYKIDPRFGTNEQYVTLVDECHKRGIKMIMDMVFNHCGSEHWFIKDLPAHDWIHQFSEFTRSNYRLSTAIDPYASAYDVTKMQQGWFDHHMPDLNQHNPLLATYLIQNTIWWIEYAQLDGIRVDTHPYPYKDFMATWTKSVMTEYPNFNIVGEVWEERVLLESYWQKDSKNRDGYEGHLPSVTDFTISSALNTAFNENDGWDTGTMRIYYALIQDHAYTDPFNNVIFLDNHDVSRYATTTGGDVRKIKMGLAALATLRGIPQLFYGTEIAIPGDGGNHGLLRADMPGGWKGDSTNVFTKTRISNEQRDVLAYTEKLFQYRKKNPTLQSGKLMHYISENGMYVYFRYTDSTCVMIILNNNEETQTLNTKRFYERMQGYTKAVNIMNEKQITDLNNLEVNAKSATILELKK